MRIRIERSWSDDRGELHELFKVIRNAPLQAGYRFATFHYEGRNILRLHHGYIGALLVLTYLILRFFRFRLDLISILLLLAGAVLCIHDLIYHLTH